MNKRNSLRIFLILLLAAFYVKTVLSSDEVVDRIVAVVNDDIITQSELEESMLPFVADYKVRYGGEEAEEKMDAARQDALNRLIEEKLILQEAKRREIEITNEEVEERLESVKSRFGVEEEFYKAIENSGVTLAELKEKYKEQIMMRKFVSSIINSKVRISPTQIAAYYNGNLADFSIPNTVRFKVLLLKPLPERNIEQTEKLALEILNRIKAGEDFDALVKEYSQGPNIDKGGDMGYMAEGSIIKELEDAMAILSAGGVSGLIKTSTGFNIIKIIDKKEASAKLLSEVNDFIRERLFQREAELTLREFVAKLKEDAYIKIQ